MGRTIVKLTEGEQAWYLEWSSIVDAPVTRGLTLGELHEHVKEQYGAEGLRELPARLARVEAHGSSSQRKCSAIDEMWLNRAGKGESVLTYRQIVEMYCKDAGEVTGHRHDYSSATTDCSRDECWSREMFDDRR